MCVRVREREGGREGEGERVDGVFAPDDDLGRISRMYVYKCVCMCVCVCVCVCAYVRLPIRHQQHQDVVLELEDVLGRISHTSVCMCVCVYVCMCVCGNGILAPEDFS